MSEAATAPRFSVELRSNNSSAVVASATYDEPAQALQAYRDATEAFRAAKMPPGSSLSLNDQKLELHAGAVSEGLGVIRHSWAKESAREQFDKLSPSKDERPEQAALRAAFAGKAAEAVKPETMPRGGSIEGIERTARPEPAAEGPAGKSSSTEKEEREDSLRKRYLKTAEGYHDKQTMELVIQDKGSRLTSTREDTATVDAIATAAIDRGWVSVGVSGSETFKREAWYQLSVRGVEVTGYSPTAADKERLNDGLRAIDGGQKPYTDSTIRDAERKDRERAQSAGKEDGKDKEKEKDRPGATKTTADPAMRSPVEEAAQAVRLVASDMAVEGGPSTPREQLAVSAAANQAYGSAVAANERAVSTARAADKGTGVAAPVPAAPARPAAARLTSEQQVMVAAVDRALRDGGMSQEQRDRVNAVVRQNVADRNPSVQVPKVADRSAIPQPAAAPAPQKQAKRDYSR